MPKCDFNKVVLHGCFGTFYFTSYDIPTCFFSSVEKFVNKVLTYAQHHSPIGECMFINNTDWQETIGC